MIFESGKVYVSGIAITILSGTKPFFRSFGPGAPRPGGSAAFCIIIADRTLKINRMPAFSVGAPSLPYVCPVTGIPAVGNYIYHRQKIQICQIRPKKTSYLDNPTAGL